VRRCVSERSAGTSRTSISHYEIRYPLDDSRGGPPMPQPKVIYGPRLPLSRGHILPKARPICFARICETRKCQRGNCDVNRAIAKTQCADGQNIGCANLRFHSLLQARFIHMPFRYNLYCRMARKCGIRRFEGMCMLAAWPAPITGPPARRSAFCSRFRRKVPMGRLPNDS
jgi:hypothetical protein